MLFRSRQARGPPLFPGKSHGRFSFVLCCRAAVSLQAAMHLFRAACALPDSVTPSRLSKQGGTLLVTRSNPALRMAGDLRSHCEGNHDAVLIRPNPSTLLQKKAQHNDSEMEVQKLCYDD